MRYLVAVLVSGVLFLAQAQDTWLDVPYVEQVKAGCGSAAVAMVVQYWAQRNPNLRKAALDMERIDKLLPASSKGIQGQAIKEFLEREDFTSYIFDGEITDLHHHFEKGRPVIVCVAPRGIRSPLHYAVVVGINDRRIWLNDSARGKLFSEDVGRFQEEWEATHNWALLAVPRQSAQ